MVDSGCPRRRRRSNLGLVVWLCLTAVVPCPAQSLAIAPRWELDCAALAGGRASRSTAVPLPEAAVLVAVVPAGADPANSTLRVGTNQVAAGLIGYDEVSRLAFYRIGSTPRPKPMDWLATAPAANPGELRALTAGGLARCRTHGWVKQVGGKVLPLALLSVGFDGAVPPRGTPLVDPDGRVAGILFDSTGAGSSAYVIPAEAIHRVRRDVLAKGTLVRGWLGLAMRAETHSPKVVRILPGSPAAAAGIATEDVLLSVGPRRILDYADAANAFFYLVPGEDVKVRVKRGGKELDFVLTPAVAPAE